MLEIIKDKKFIFFDVGYTLYRPVSGDWHFTNFFYELTRDKLSKLSKQEIDAAKKKGYEYQKTHHLLETIDEEIEISNKYFEIVSNELSLGLTHEQINNISVDSIYNFSNYALYDNVRQTLEELSKIYKLGIISDTWPSIEIQLKKFGIYDYFTTYTYSYKLGVFKPDSKMFNDAITKCGYKPKDTVFIDDQVYILKGAKEYGITPILIAANKASDVESEFKKIYNISDLLKNEG